jgi:hypothetical protein
MSDFKAVESYWVVDMGDVGILTTYEEMRALTVAHEDGEKSIWINGVYGERNWVPLDKVVAIYSSTPESRERGAIQRKYLEEEGMGEVLPWEQD